jgi:hypothetical protein
MISGLLDTLHDSAVRDLAWVISSPGLVDAAYPEYLGHVVKDDWYTSKLAPLTDWLAKLDHSPQVLHEYIAAHPTRRLGHYFETLIAFWLMHTADIQIIARNLQVQDAQRTLGEYDFLLRNADAEVSHWEAAVKFYLQIEASAEQHSFIGPGTRDRLDLKLERVFNHQLRLSQTEAGLRALPNNIKPDKTLAYIKGYLFYHATAFNRQAITGISAAHLSGWWIRHSTEKIPQISANSGWVIPPRMHWLAPARLPAETEVMTYAQLQDKLDKHFGLYSEALLLFEMLRTEQGAWQEISRGFIVCTSWPEIPQGKQDSAHQQFNQLKRPASPIS